MFFIFFDVWCVDCGIFIKICVFLCVVIVKGLSGGVIAWWLDGVWV